MDPGPYLEIINFVGPPICKYWNYHSKYKQHLNILRSKKEQLNSRKEDIKRRLDSELRFQKTMKKEVENWLDKVEKIIDEIQSLEDEVGKVKYVSRASVGKRVCEKIIETTNVYDEGSFSGSLVIDAPSNSGMALSPPKLVGETDVKEKIWEYLMGDSVCKVGVCGMGGIGKTTIMKHIHNDLLGKAKFAKVIWVTVPLEFDVFKLQKEIATTLREDLSEHNDTTIRAAMLSQMLEERKRYVLILDDVWKRFFLEDVGIPEPTISNGCKLVLTTRSIDLALSMGCKTVKVSQLSEGEALNLFLNHVKLEVYNPTLESIMKQVIKECAGLPLAIVTIASRMRGKNEVRVWKNALNKLKKHVGSIEGMAEEVFQRLKYSYDRLPNIKIKHCFLYCALYPEDFEISKEELIEYWIVEGLIDEMETRQEMYDEGLSILESLENNFLLEKVEKGARVKMHDVVRDLALHITSESPRYLAKSGMQLEELPKEQEWNEDVAKVSLMRNRIKEISSYTGIPKCGRISTMLLQHNKRLETIHESFFTLITGLKILDLSYNWSIKTLPNSVSELENLNALLLHDCSDLKYVPSLSKLRGLKKLDLGGTDIEEVPLGMEMLVRLRYLDLNTRSLRELPAGILPKLSHLQHLMLDRIPAVIVEEVARLRKLETLAVRFNNLQDYHLYLSQLQPGCLNRYVLKVGCWSWNQYWSIKFEKYVGFEGLGFCGDNSIMLPTDLKELSIEGCHDIRSLSDHMRCCYNILEWLYLRDLNNFSVLFRGEREGAALTPMLPGTLSRLKYIAIKDCPKIEKLFWPELVHSLQNLEEVVVRDCEQLVEIIAALDDDEEKKQEEGKASMELALPRLRKMTFGGLPKLKSICDHGSLMDCKSLEEIYIYDCPKLNRIPLLLTQLDNGGQLRPPASLKEIKIDSDERWDSLEWDHPNFKNVLQPYVNFLPSFFND